MSHRPISGARPPVLAEWLLLLTTPARHRLEALGDLSEDFQLLVRERSLTSAKGWYWRQAMTSMVPNLLQRAPRPRKRIKPRKGDGFMQPLMQDLRYSFRNIHRNWAFSLVIMATLALGIGANTLIYSVVDGVVLNPFPFPEPDELVGIGSEWPRLSRELGFWETLSPQEYADVKAQSQTMEHIVMWDMGYRSVSSTGEGAVVVFSAFWFDNAFPTLGMNPIHGRGFSDEELQRGDPVAVLSYRHWLTHLGGDPTKVGSRIFVDGEPYTLIGVMPPRSQILATDLWIPIGASPDRFSRNSRQMQILARIKDGFTLEDANVELAAISGRIEQEYAAEFEEYGGWRMRALTWTDVNVRLLKPAAFALLGAVGFVLLIVCANIASLLLAKASSRRREIAVRIALGASRKRIIRQLLTESTVLSGLGGVLGVIVTFVTLPTLLALVPRSLPLVLDVSVNMRVLLFSAAVSVLAGLIFGIVPALHGSKSDLQGAFKADGGASTSSRGKQRLQRLFVGAEFAVALALLAQAGLLINSFVRMQNVDPGFDVSNTLTMRLTLPRARYRTGESIVTFFQQLTENVEELPGVLSAGAGTQYPPIVFSRGRFSVEGEQYDSGDDLPVTYLTEVTDGYIEAIGYTLIRGRTFTPQDTPNTPIVAVINEVAARRFFATADAIGKRFKLGPASSGSPWVTVVGVIGSVRNRGPEVDPQPEIFANIRQLPDETNQLFLVVRTERNPREFLDGVQNVVAALDPEQPVYAVQTVEEAYAVLAGPRRIGTTALIAFAMFALALAAAGIYAVVSYGVNERTKEIGLRMALGASDGAVRKLVVRQAMVPVIVGGVVGLTAAIGLGRAMSSFLFQVDSTDPVTLGLVALLLAAFAVAASYLPAWRASRLDPTTALRNE